MVPRTGVTALLSTGASLIEVDTTVVVVSLAVAEPSLTAIVKVVVSVEPDATRLSVGSNMRPCSAVVAAAAVPVKV